MACRELCDRVVGEMGRMSSTGGQESDTRMGCRVIKACVARFHGAGGARVTRGQFLEGMRGAVQRKGTTGTCTAWMRRVLERACQRLLGGGLSEAPPPLDGFALDWRLHQGVAEGLFRGLRRWFRETPAVMALNPRESRMMARLGEALRQDALFLGSLLPGGLSGAKLVLGVHELAVQHGVGLDDDFGLLMWELFYRLYGKSVLAFGVLTQAPPVVPADAGYSLLQAAEPYGALCRGLAEECERLCAGPWRGSQAATLRMLERLTPVVGEQVKWGTLRVGGEAPGGYNSAHLSFAVLRAAEERWGSSGGLACTLLHLGCVRTMGLSVTDGRPGLPRDDLLKGAEAVGRMSETVVKEAVYVCARFRSERRRLQGLDEVLGLAQEKLGIPLGCVMLEVQRQLSASGAGRTGRVWMQLWRLFQRRTGHALFPAAEYEAAVAAELARGVERREEQAVRMCERVAALCAASGLRAGLNWAERWLRSRRMGPKRVAHQRAAIVAALRLPEGVPAFHPVVPIAIREAFLSVYGSPLLER